MNLRRAAWVATILTSLSLGAQTVGQPAASLPPWTPGTLYIHHISTGRGNSTFFVFPDGTTLLVDAGAAGAGVPQTDPHPNASRTPGTWIADYIKRHLPFEKSELDYALITHFHGDHMAGITDVDAAVPIHTLLDRGWPDYSYPAPVTDPATAAYRQFFAARRTGGMTISRFKPGSSSQLTLQREPARYPTFEIRNIIANGEVWTGAGEETRQLFPPIDKLAKADLPSENMCSAGFRLRYGRFRYFTGGDLPGAQDPGFPAWHAVEPALAPIVGPVDVQVINQHGSMGEATDAWLEKLRSTVLIIPSWAPSHPAPDVLKRIINSRYPPTPRYVYATDLREAARIVIGARANQLAGPTGHIVVRVEPGGEHYRVFVLDSNSPRDVVLSTAGPFTSASVN